jgi:rhamnose utilization protein RhaD (predicted bifunctional aldolase and dehydrogenase)
MNVHPRVVTESELEKALDFLRDNAREIGEAKGETVRASHMLKVTKALVMKAHNELSAAKAEVEAYASAEYAAALERDATAASEYEKLRALREAAALKIEAWRSEQANYRAMRV